MNTQTSTRVLKTLVLAMATTCAAGVYAQSSSEVEQLRNEVKILRGLVEQYSAQQQSLSAHLVTNQTQLNLAKSQAQPAAVPSSGLKLSTVGSEISFYGNVRADMSYQVDGGSDSRLYNQINTVPLNGNSNSQDRLKATLAATRFGLDFKSNLTQAKVGGKLEMDFLGSGDSLRIRHAYITYNDWLVGQTWSNFAVPDYMPESIDALGYVGGSVKRTIQVQRRFNFTPTTNLIVALEDPKDASSNMRLPALTSRLNHKFSDDLAVSLRGMVSEKKIQSDESTAWGVGLGAKYALTPSTTLKADYYHVKGDSSFVAWSNPGFIADKQHQIVAENEFDSITVGLTQQFNPQWRGTLGYGYMKADKNNTYLNAVADQSKVNKDLWQAWGNVFYSPVKPISLGVEYVYGEREAFAAENGSNTGTDNRVNAVAIYNF